MKPKYWMILVIIIIMTVFYYGQSYFLQRSFENTKWILTNGLQIDKSVNVEITLEFEPDKRISGFSGVNSYGGNYRVKLNKQIEFTETYSTLIASTDPIINENERQFFNLLELVKHYQKIDDILNLMDNDNQVLLEFKRKN